MITAALFVIAAAGGALLRAEAGRRWNRSNGVAVGTLFVNVTGSFCLGLLTNVGQPAITIVGVGGLGAYTTFSSFARDAVALGETAQVRQAVGYVVASCVLGISGGGIGHLALEQLIELALGRFGRLVVNLHGGTSKSPVERSQLAKKALRVPGNAS